MCSTFWCSLCYALSWAHAMTKIKPVISFEGVDGAGKTTLANMLNDWLVSQKYGVHLSREPFGAPVFNRGDKFLGCKALLEGGEFSASSEVLMYLMSRVENIRFFAEVSGSVDVIVVDRFVDSTLAYQCYGLGKDAEMVEKIASLIGADYAPDLTFFVNAKNGIPADRRVRDKHYDHIGGDFMDSVLCGYREVFSKKENIDRVVSIDNSDSIEESFREVKRHVNTRILNREAGAGM